MTAADDPKFAKGHQASERRRTCGREESPNEHVDADGTPRVVVAQHNLKIVKTFEEVYEDR